MTGRADWWITRRTIGCVALLALIAGTVSYLHMNMLVALHEQARVGRRTDAAVFAWDDRGGVHDAAGRLAVRPAGRGAAVGAADHRQRGQPGRQRRGGRAHAVRRMRA